jgi:hypothetical protein
MEKLDWKLNSRDPQVMRMQFHYIGRGMTFATETLQSGQSRFDFACQMQMMEQERSRGT